MTEQSIAFSGTGWQLAGLAASAAGVALLAWAVRLRMRGPRLWSPGPRGALSLVRTGRAVLVGGGLLGVGVGVLLHVQWLVVLSLIIGGQELLETSVIAAALREEERRRAAEGRAAA